MKYVKAKVVLLQHKEGDDFGALLTSMGVCHSSGARLLHTKKKLLSTSATSTASSIRTVRPPCGISLACLPTSSSTRRPPHDLRRQLLCTRGCSVNDHTITIMIAKKLSKVCQLAVQSDRGAIDVGHSFRMCSCCGAVSEAIDTCPCIRAWYCNADCQLQHWPTHKPNCAVCFQCSTVLTKVLLLALQAGQVLQRCMPDGAAEAAQEGLFRTDETIQAVRYWKLPRSALHRYFFV